MINSFALDQVKTADLAAVIRNLGLKKVLVITPGDDRTLSLSSRNIKDVKVMSADGLNVYDILKYDTLLLVESSIQAIEGRFV